MAQAQFQFLTDLENHLRSGAAKPVDPAWHVTPERCPENMPGDLTVNTFRFARFFGMAPDKIAAAAADFLQNHPDVEAVSVVKAFVNVTLRPAALHRDSSAATATLLEAVKLDPAERRKILIEYSAPNTNKPQHLGHVRNNTLGMSLASLLQRVGHEVFQINLVNDRGIHICKSMLAYQRFGNGVTPETAGKKGDHLVGDFYVRYAQELSKEIKELRSAHPEFADRSDDELFLETEIGSSAQEMLRRWEAGDEAVRKLWKLMNSWVLAGFAETYQRMGIHFTRTYYESETYLLGKDIIADGLAKGAFHKREDGAVLADLGKLGEKVVLRKDGTSVYITQDIGTTVRKFNDFHPDTQIWVVGDEQILHFQMLFAILDKLGYPWAKELFHLSYGMVNLPSGRMKSREGTVVDADDLFDEMVSLARTACAERAGDTATAAELDDRAEKIGMGALKFMLLKYNAKTTILFDPAGSIKFEGDTGPYVQYACARVGSIRRKAQERGIAMAEDLSQVDWSLLAKPEEKSLAVALWFYPAAVKLAAQKRDCSGLVEYLLDLAKNFNRFYRECPVLTAETPALAAARLALAEQTRKILVDGLNTLTIQVPDAM